MKRFLLSLMMLICLSCNKADLPLAPQSEPTVPTQGELIINAVDEQLSKLIADVWLNGEKVGQTPFKTSVLFGQHEITIYLEGFFKFRTSIQIEETTNNSQYNVVAEMRALPISNTSIARVILRAKKPELLDFTIQQSDNIVKAFTSVTGIDESLTPEVYTFKAALAGYEPWQRTINLQDNEIFVADIELYRTYEPESLQGLTHSPQEIMLSPKNPRVQSHFIGNYSSGDRVVTWQTQLSSTNLDVAAVDANGVVTRGDSTGVAYIVGHYQGFIDSLKVTNRVAEPGFGEFGLSTNPLYAGVQIFNSQGQEIDLTGRATPFIIKLPVGAYSYIIWLHGYKPVAGTVEIVEGRLTPVHHDLELAPGQLTQPRILWQGELAVNKGSQKSSEFTLAEALGRRFLIAIITYTPGQRSEHALLKIQKDGNIVLETDLPDLDQDQGHHREYPEIRNLGDANLPAGECEIEFISTGSGSAVLTHLIAF